MAKKEPDIIETEEQWKWYKKGQEDSFEDLACLWGLLIGILIGVVFTLITLSFL